MPWSVPVPVKRSTFVSLHAKHRECNVEVDLGAIRAFASTHTHTIPETRLLYSDLQKSIDTNVPGRLGSGRSGFYRNWYLKGMGRTLLASNWNRAADIYHNSGHLLPSAAIREYLTSVYLRAKKGVRSIVPCEGILFRPIDKSLDNYVVQVFGRGDTKGLEIDKRFQAITVKRDGFIRISNLSWLLDRIGVDLIDRESFQSLLGFFGLLHSAFTGSATLTNAITPADLVRAIDQAVDAGVRNFRTYFAAGIYWGSFHNNFTADGRFLDLEVPQILGRPFVGSVLWGRPSKRRVPFSPKLPLVGTELIFFLKEMRLFVKFLEHRLAFLLAMKGHRWRKSELEFTEELVLLLGRHFGKNHLVNSKAAVCEVLHDTFARHFSPTPSESRQLKLMLSSYLGHFLDRPVRGRPQFKMDYIEPSLARSEPSRVPMYLCPEFLIPTVDLSMGEFLGREITRIEAIKDLDRLLHELSRLGEKLAGMAT